MPGVLSKEEKEDAPSSPPWGIIAAVGLAAVAIGGLFIATSSSGEAKVATVVEAPVKAAPAKASPAKPAPAAASTVAPPPTPAAAPAAAAAELPAAPVAPPTTPVRVCALGRIAAQTPHNGKPYANFSFAPSWSPSWWCNDAAFLVLKPAQEGRARVRVRAQVSPRF